MATPKKKTSKSKSGMRRSHYKVASPALSFDKDTGLYRLAHRICPTTGRYGGKKVVEVEDEQ